VLTNKSGTRLGLYTRFKVVCCLSLAVCDLC
jgi:hypothetical protein